MKQFKKFTKAHRDKALVHVTKSDANTDYALKRASLHDLKIANVTLAILSNRDTGLETQEARSSYEEMFKIFENSFINKLRARAEAVLNNHKTYGIKTCHKNTSEKGDEMIKSYRKKGLQKMRPYVPGEDLTHVSVSKEDTPELGGMIAINPDNSKDNWYIDKKWFQENYEEVEDECD
jgi:hypothetical protein